MNKDRKDLVERLRNISRGDHERGCQGREYVCSCDYDETSWKTAEEAAAELDRLRRELEEARKALAQQDIDQGIAAILADDTPADPGNLALFDRAIAAAKERLTSRATEARMDWATKESQS